jgi:hypothetical protein
MIQVRLRAQQAALQLQLDDAEAARDEGTPSQNKKVSKH